MIGCASKFGFGALPISFLARVLRHTWMGQRMKLGFVGLGL